MNKNAILILALLVAGPALADPAKRQTTIVYDDAKTNFAALSKATADAGFPSSPVQAAK